MSGNSFVEVHTWRGSYGMDQPLFRGCAEREWIHLVEVSAMRLAEEGIRYVIQHFNRELVWCGATSFFFSPSCRPLKIEIAYCVHIVTGLASRQ